MLGIPGEYLGQGYPLYPGLTVTGLSLARDSVLATAPIPVLVGLVRWRAGHLPVIRLAAVALAALLWFWAAAMLIDAFAIDFGTTWSGTEALRALFLHRLHTPFALALVAVVTYLAAGSRGRAR